MEREEKNKSENNNDYDSVKIAQIFLSKEEPSEEELCKKLSEKISEQLSEKLPEL